MTARTSVLYRWLGACVGSRSFERLAVCLSFALFAHGSEAALVDLISKSKPSIVAIGTFNATDSPRFSFRGTGFVVKNGNLVVTNAHVLPDTAVLQQFGTRLAAQVIDKQGRVEWRTASIMTIDRTHDLVLLQIDGSPLPALPLAGPSNAPEGLAVAFIGYPIGSALGFTAVTHRGIVSAITAIALPMPSITQLNEKTVSRLRRGAFDIYQLDATAFPGNSGGPLLNVETAEVIGVINMVFVKSTKEAALRDPSGITYAIPVKYVNELLQDQ